MDDEERNELLARYAKEEARRLIPTELLGLEYLYSRSQNYFAAWRAIDLCARYDELLPGWVMEYLASAAAKLIDNVPINRALGATQGRGGKGSARARFEKELRGLGWFIEIENVLQEDPRATIDGWADLIAKRERAEWQTVRKTYFEWRKRLRGKRRIVAPPL